VSVIEFTAEVVLLSASGVLSPGPLFLANLIYGSKGGIKIALGHTIVELPLIIILALSIFEYSSFTLTEECLRMIGFDRRDCNNNIFSSTNKQYHKKTRNYCRHPQQA
jgi:ABC-type tungstate transport system substrate-binding protein